MCLLLFAFEMHPHYRLVLAANRDEFYNRPTRPASFWEQHPAILAGRDLRAGGTWMGVTRTGRMAALTNFRRSAQPTADALSRGLLVGGFLTGNTPPKAYLEQVQSSRRGSRLPRPLTPPGIRFRTTAVHVVH